MSSKMDPRGMNLNVDRLAKKSLVDNCNHEWGKEEYCPDGEVAQRLSHHEGPDGDKTPVFEYATKYTSCKKCGAVKHIYPSAKDRGFDF